MCKEAWSKKLNYLCTDMTKNMNEGKYRFFNENKRTHIECIPKVNLIDYINVIFN